MKEAQVYVGECESLENNFDAFSHRFREREDMLILVSQLNQLVKAVQRHRGISMGMLGGNTEFQSEFQSLQGQLERRLATLESFAKTTQLLSDRDKENLSLAWATIRTDWEDDNLSDNFELHSHFIEQLLFMIASLAKRLELPLLFHVNTDMPEAQSRAFSEARSMQQSHILDLICKELPEMIEECARLRGTAAYSAAVGSTDGLDERKIRFWMSSLKAHNEKVRALADKLHKQTGAALSGLTKVRRNEVHLLKFVNTVESALFKGNGGREEAHQLFLMATEVIEVYWEVVNDGLSLVQQWHRQDLEAWISL